MNSYCRRRLHSFFLLLFAILVAGTGRYAGAHAVKCLPDQEASLLDLKQGFRFDSELSEPLVSWKPGYNCCSWEGVTCDTESGHVIGLNLNSPDIYGNLSSSLFNLTSLQTLNLAGSFFEGVPNLQSGFERLTKLKHLYLNYMGLSGQIPIGISHLTSLISLDLSGRYEFHLRNTNLQMLVKNLSNLRELHLEGVNMSSEHDWSKTLSKSLPRLQVLSLFGCDLPGSLPNDFFSTYKNLTFLDLSFNPRLSGVLPDFPTDNALQILYLHDSNFSGPIPASIANLTQLVSMDLSWNCLTGVIPASIGSLIQLESMYLSRNCLMGVIPTSIGSLIQLEHMVLSSNSLSGPVPSFEPQAKLHQLDLSNNSLIGPIPMSLFCLPHLYRLDLSYNQLSGELGEFLNPSTSLQSIDLSNNQLQGWISRSISKMSGLESFYIESNNFSVELDMFNSLRNLSGLSVSNNKLIQDVSENNFHTFPKLSVINLASCNLSKIPAFLKYQDGLVQLDLSNNRINGSIPKWIWMPQLLNLSFNSFSNIKGPIDLTTTNLLYLFLQSNMLQGPIPLLPPGIVSLDYSNNNFSSTIPSNIFFNLYQIEIFSLANNIIIGEIPPSICTAKTLRVLDFSNNNLSGSIPSCLLEANNSLLELNLRGNQLRGIIPQNISKGCTLERIMFDGNSLQGQLPRSLINCISLEVLDLGNNHIMDSFPYWLRDLITLRVLILRENKFYGPINCVRSPGINYALSELQIFDLSSNHFNGSLSSECFNALKAMLNSSQLGSSTMGFYFYNLGNFSTPTNFVYDVVSVTNKGKKSTMRKLLTIFTYVDFSNNAFEGDIPEVIGELQGLHVLNLSHNFLSGDIPPTIGNMKQIESLDLSANSLSGEIPNEIVSLTFLSYLNLSDNNFIGKIPQGNQFSTFSNASFQENPGLCGSPLSKQCGNASPKITDAVSPSESDSSSSTYVIGLALFVGLGFGVGFAVILVLQNVPLKFWRKE